MKQKFDIWASSLFALIEEPLTTRINVKLPADHPLETLSHHTTARIETLLHIDSTEIQSFWDGYMEDPYFKNVMGSFPKEAPFIYKSYQQSPDDLIFFHDSSGCCQLCVPSSLQWGIMEEIHESTTGAVHGGFEQTYSQIANSYSWPRMTRDIHMFISTCPICQKIKHAWHLPYSLLQPIPILTQPFEVVMMDFISELPRSQNHDLIFVLICKLTKYAFFIPCDTKLTEKWTAPLFFDKIITHVSLPKQIISDQDTWWRNSFWKEVCESMGSWQALTTAYHLQADRQMEILNQTIDVAIHVFINKNRSNWVSVLPYLAFAYNNSLHTAMKYAPSYLLYRFHPHTPFNFLTNELQIEQANLYKFNSPKAQQFTEDITVLRLAAKDTLKLTQHHFEDSYNKNHIHTTYKPGDQVLTNIHLLQLPESKGPGAKFTRWFDGPFEVTEQVSPVTYHIWLPHSYRIHPILSIMHLEPYRADVGDHWKDLKRIWEDLEEHKVKEIMEQRCECHCKCYWLMYKCQWKNEEITDKWIPESALRNAKEILDSWKLKMREEKLRK